MARYRVKITFEGIIEADSAQNAITKAREDLGCRPVEERPHLPVIDVAATRLAQGVEPRHH